MDIRDHPRTVANVERARLLGYIGCREMMVHEGAERRIAILGDYTTGLVVDKAVDHHAIIPGQRAECRRSARTKCEKIARPFEVARDSVKPRQQCAGRSRRFGRVFEFRDQQLAGTVERYVVGSVLNLQRLGEERSAGPRRRVPDQNANILPQQIGQIAAEPVQSQITFQLTGACHHAKRFRVSHQQNAVRLYRTRHMDRLTVASGKVEVVVSLGTQHSHLTLLPSRFVASSVASKAKSVFRFLHGNFLRPIETRLSCEEQQAYEAHL